MANFFESPALPATAGIVFGIVLFAIITLATWRFRQWYNLPPYDEHGFVSMVSFANPLPRAPPPSEVDVESQVSAVEEAAIDWGGEMI
jgi:hypothetical protein